MTAIPLFYFNKKGGILIKERDMLLKKKRGSLNKKGHLNEKEDSLKK